MLLKLHSIGWEAYHESYIRRDTIMTFFMEITLTLEMRKIMKTHLVLDHKSYLSSLQTKVW